MGTHTTRGIAALVIAIATTMHAASASAQDVADVATLPPPPDVTLPRQAIDLEIAPRVSIDRERSGGSGLMIAGGVAMGVGVLGGLGSLIALLLSEAASSSATLCSLGGCGGGGGDGIGIAGGISGAVLVLGVVMTVAGASIGSRGRDGPMRISLGGDRSGPTIAAQIAF